MYVVHEPRRKRNVLPAILLLVAVNLPQIHALTDNIDTAWKLYDGMDELVKAMLCGWIAYLLTQPHRVYAITASAWFVGQAIDEFSDGNYWMNGKWEFGWMLLLIIAAWLLGKKLA